MGFTETRALDIYYGEDRKPRDIDGKQIGFIGEDIKGGHLATQINFHFEEGDIGEHGAVVIIAKRADGQMRYDLCSKSGTGTSAYYYAELNNWYLEKHGSLILDVKAYTNDSEAAVTIVDGVLTPATGTKIIVGTTFTFDVKYAPLPTTQVSATELSTIELILLAVQSKPDFVDIVKVSVSLPSDLGDTPNEYDGRWFLINDGKDGILYYIDGDTPIEANIGTTIAKLLDCDIDSLASGDVLLWNGTKWENSTRLATAEVTIASNVSRIGTAEVNINNHEGRLTTAEETLEILVDTGGIEVNKYDTLGDFPATGSDLRLYLARDTDKMYHWETDAYVEVSNDVNIDSAVDKGIVFYDATQGKIDTDTKITYTNGALNIDKIRAITGTYASSTEIELTNSGTTIRNDSPYSAVALKIESKYPSNNNNLLEIRKNPNTGYETPVPLIVKIDKDGVFYGAGLNITGDIIQQGSAYETHAEQVYTTNNEIILRDGAVGGLAVGSYAGLRAKLADGTNDSLLQFDGNGIARVGDEGSTQALATRQDSPTSNGIAYWNASAYRFDTSSGLTTDLGDNANVGLLINKLGTGTVQEWQVAGTAKARVGLTGYFSGSGISNIDGSNNSVVASGTNGTSITRNRADANHALIVNLANASSTGNITNFQWQGANKLEITKDGFINQNGTRFIHNYTHAAVGGVQSVGRNTYVGLNAGNLSTSKPITETFHDAYNVGVGYQALNINTLGYYNTALGGLSLLVNETGSENTALGFQTLTANTSGVNNVAVGTNALANNISSHHNTGIGHSALFGNTLGAYNTALGFRAGRFIADNSTANTTSDYSTYLGSNTKASADNSQNEIVIGYNAIGQGSNSVVLGNTDITKTILRGLVGINQPTPTSQLHIVSSATDKVGLIVDMPISATEHIQKWQLNSSNVAYITTTGRLYGTGIRHINSEDNAMVDLATTGTTISRNVADADNTYAALKINNQQGNGDIVKFQYGGNSYLRIDKDGNIRASERALIISSEEGASLTLSTSGDSYLDSGISNLYLDGGSVIVSADLELDAKLKDYANSTGTAGQVMKVNATGYPEWKSPKPTDTLLGSKSTTGLIDFGTDDIYNYDEIIVELVFNNSPEFIKSRTMIPSSELVYGSEEPTIAVLGFDGTNVIHALVSTTAAAGDELNVAAISADCSVNIYGRNY